MKNRIIQAIEQAVAEAADGCGKCAAIVPCSFCDPVQSASRRHGERP